MKRFALTLAFALVAVGCHGQLPPNPTINTCQVATGAAYTPIGSTSASTLTDTHPPAGSWCYIQQSTLGTQVSVPSNIAGPYTTSGSNSVALTWNMPTSGPTPTGSTISRAPAIQSTINPATLVNGNVAEVKPALVTPDTKAGVYALLSAPNLRGSVR